jgi:hypothetical protein
MISPDKYLTYSIYYIEALRYAKALRDHLPTFANFEI